MIDVDEGVADADVCCFDGGWCSVGGYGYEEEGENLEEGF